MLQYFWKKIGWIPSGPRALCGLEDLMALMILESLKGVAREALSEALSILLRWLVALGEGWWWFGKVRWLVEYKLEKKIVI